MIEQYIPETTEPTIALKDTKPADIFRFAVDSFEESLKDSLFYIRVDAPELKTDRVRFINIQFGNQLERDGCHRVVVHKCTHRIVK
jgi:hypothetical protein